MTEPTPTTAETPQVELLTQRYAGQIAGTLGCWDRVVITGTLDTYRQIFTGKLDPIQALMTRKLELQGNLGKIMKAVKATLDLVKCCGQIETQYADQV